VNDLTSVVVVSTDVGTRSHVRLTLGDDRFEIREAGDTASAIHLVAEQQPAVMVLDLDLPGGGALALARSLRSQPETETVRTLVLVPRGGTVPDESTGIDASLMVPATTFALLKKVDGLLTD
jgi:two-component system, OmpR family, phosphate regulon response regulator PhoB